MNYLMIQNDGVCPIEGYTVLGLSTNRYKKEAIGQFGSGNKYALTCLLRQEIYPVLCRGGEVHEFSVEKREFRGSNYGQVLMDGEPLGFCLGHGIHDWTEPWMAIREYISNAIDEGGVVIDLRYNVEPRDGCTRIFIPVCEHVYKFLAEKDKRFVNLAPGVHAKANREISGRGCMVYRKGVFVRQLPGEGLFDYNITELDIDECRNANHYTVAKGIANSLANASGEILEKLFDNLNSIYWEIQNLDSWDFENQGDWLRHWKHGLISCDSREADIASRRGYTVKVVSERWYMILKKMGIRCVEDELNEDERKGRTLHEPSAQVLDVAHRIWASIDAHGLTFPKFVVFDQPHEVGLKGFYKNGICFIRAGLEGEDLGISVLEEIIHHITGATDYSVDFQEFIIKELYRRIQE